MQGPSFDGPSYVLIAVAVAVLAAVATSYVSLRRVWGRSGRFPPGPRSWPVFGNLHLLADLPHQSLAKLARTYGPLMSLRLGSTLFVVASTPEMAKNFLHTYDHNFASRPRTAATSHLLFNSTDLAFAPYGPYWKLVRRMCMTHVFLPRRLDSFKPIRLEEARDLMRLVLQHSRSGQPILLRPRVQEAANNIISRITLSKKYTELRSAARAGDIVALIDEIMLLLGVPNVGDFIPYLAWMDLQGWEKRMKAARKKVQRVLGEIIEGRRAEFRARATDKFSVPDSHEDLLDVLLRETSAEQKNSDVQLSDENITAVVLDMYLGGTDTTSITTEWAMAELLANPACLKKVQEELDREVGTERLVEDSDMAELPYLQAVVQETFRLHPAAPLLLPRQSMEACTVEGYDLPAGTCVYVNVWAIGRDRGTWEDPLSFRPERFLGSEVNEKGQYFQLLPFGSGRRRCVGWELGLLNVRLFLARLLQAFQWTLPLGANHVDMTEQFGLTVMMANSLTVHASPRVSPTLYA